MTTTIRFFLVFLLFCLGCSSKKEPHIPDSLSKEKLSLKNRAVVKKQKKQVIAELSKLKDHPWAGSYCMVYPPGWMGIDEEFVIAPKSGFIYTCRSNDWIDEYGGVLYDQNYGNVAWEGDCLKLSPVLANEGNGYECSTELVPITWDDRLYLVPANGIVEFCNDVNKGGAIIYFVRGGDRTKPPMGMPDVSDEFKPYLLKKPVEGQVITVGETKEICKQFHKKSYEGMETAVTINKGTQDGLLPGMKLWATDTRQSLPIILTVVRETESDGIIEGYAEHYEMPQISQMFTTRRYP